MIGHKRKYDFYRRIIAFQEKRGWNDVCGVVSNCVLSPSYFKLHARWLSILSTSTRSSGFRKSVFPKIGHIIHR
ncbi:hypothetical protein SAMN05444147_102548 [Pectobacterium carotovorum]|nr:hypothetical protein SAMN05444147_102548 [Pectobacterium carotovorum]